MTMAATSFAQQLNHIEDLTKKIKNSLDADDTDAAYEEVENALELLASLRSDYIS